MPHDRTRDAVIAKHIAMATTRTDLTMETYAQDVADLYRARTPEHLRSIQFHVYQRGGDAYAVQRANAQLVRRQVDGTVRMGVEIEEALVLALPEPFRSRCLLELNERLGLLAAALPAADGAEQLVQLGELLQEYGDTVSALAPIYADGRVDAADAAHAANAIKELSELMAKATTLMAALCRVSAVPSNVQPLSAAKKVLP